MPTKEQLEQRFERTRQKADRMKDYEIRFRNLMSKTDYNIMIECHPIEVSEADNLRVDNQEYDGWYSMGTKMFIRDAAKTGSTGRSIRKGLICYIKNELNRWMETVPENQKNIVNDWQASYNPEFLATALNELKYDKYGVPSEEKKP